MKQKENDIKRPQISKKLKSIDSTNSICSNCQIESHLLYKFLFTGLIVCRKCLKEYHDTRQMIDVIPNKLKYILFFLD